MKAVVIDGGLSVQDVPMPVRGEGEALVHVSRAGICNTDHEILKGYVPGFAGIPGHEFVGTVVESDDARLRGARVTAEINVACGVCDLCTRGLGRHCPTRTVIGIVGRDGVMAEYAAIPEENLVVVPDHLSDTEAVFVEPVSAACEILEQTTVDPDSDVLVIGDGKLGLLVAMVLAATGCRLTVSGKHPEKLALLEGSGAQTCGPDSLDGRQFDMVVEACGNPGAFASAVATTRPRGTIVLKSTYAENLVYNPAPIVVNELTVIGSRCGRFAEGITFIEQHRPPLERLVSASYPIGQALEAFSHSDRPESLKVLVTMEQKT